jgi:hypothetical protein
MWEERKILSVASLTRHDGFEFFRVAQCAGVRTTTRVYPLARTNDALDDLRAGRFGGNENTCSRDEALNCSQIYPPERPLYSRAGSDEVDTIYGHARACQRLPGLR